MYHQMYRAAMTEDEACPWNYELVDPVVFCLLRNVMARLNPDQMKARLEARNENANGLDDATLLLFQQYLDERRNYLTASNPQLFAPPPQPEMLPTDEEALAQSMSQDLNIGGNPTENLPITLTDNQVAEVFPFAMTLFSQSISTRGPFRSEFTEVD